VRCFVVVVPPVRRSEEADVAGRTWTTVLGNSQRLDGGAMFGNAPKALWERWVEVDGLNRIPLATRSVLIREGSGRVVLLEAGVGAFFPPEQRERYGIVEHRHVLLDGLTAEGIGAGDVDVVVLSHLHFDHAGGVLTAWSPDRPPELVFPNASYVVGRTAWGRAVAPTPRDRASFIPELPALLEATGRVELVDGAASSTLGGGVSSSILGAGYRFHVSDGHTPGLLLTEFDTADGPVVYASDLVPGVPWVHVPITMGYDRFPELVVEEKAGFLSDVVDRSVRVVFTHDPTVDSALIGRDDHGRFVVA
jgi:glyoxylase-like metal-dependent hydrolase (beta-lactamase superfamily II)